jgi:hypothetical protein
MGRVAVNHWSANQRLVVRPGTDSIFVFVSRSRVCFANAWLAGQRWGPFAMPLPPTTTASVAAGMGSTEIRSHGRTAFGTRDDVIDLERIVRVGGLTAKPTRLLFAQHLLG